MPPRVLFDQTGKKLELGSQIAAGGEGTVYACPDSARVLKLYHQPPDAARVRKLRWMVEHTAPELSHFAAWPTALLSDARNGPVVGFAMPRFDGFRPIHVLYSPAHRRSGFPQADWAFLIHAARNCCAAFDALHSRGHVVGDVNQSNVLVSPQAVVGLIDCDSFEIQAGSERFRCEVGVGPYTPPELQGKSFHGVDRSANHDRFGLAVLLFHLLFMGRHPFAGRFSGGDKSIEEAIAERRFAYAADTARTGMTPPPFTLPLTVLSPQLAAYFEQAFGDSPERPTPAQWHAALGEFEKGLYVCGRDAGHKVPDHVADCPWCGLMARGGPNFFLGVSTATGDFTFDAHLFEQLFQQFETLQHPDFDVPTIDVDIRPPQTPPTTWRQRAHRILGGARWMGIGFTFWMIVLLWLIYGPAGLSGWIFWVGLILMDGLLWPFRRLARWAESEEKDVTPKVVNQLAKQLNSLRQDYLLTSHRYGEEYNRQLDVVRPLRAEVLGLPKAFLVERTKLEQLHYDRQRKASGATNEDDSAKRAAAAREHHLETQFLQDYRIPGFGPGRLALLASYGVETAADVTDTNLSDIRGIGPKLRKTLFDWRKSVEKGFKFDPNAVIPGTQLQHIPPEELRRLLLHFQQRQEALRGALQKGFQDLRALTVHTETQVREVLAQREKLVREAAALGADLR